MFLSNPAQASVSVNRLTRYPEGSLREIWWISFPLMLSALSWTLMFFLDRLILAYYSIQAMNAAATAWVSSMVFIFGLMGITSIAEVFVGQYNGAKQYKRLGAPVWQMIWLALLSMWIFWLVAWWAGDILVPQIYWKEGLPYFNWLMGFGSVPALSTALTAFYIGQGKVVLVTSTTIFSNVLNVVLDIVLVFGVQGYVSAMGAEGAAIATVISQCVQVLILFAVFLNHHHREHHGTTHWKIQRVLFWECMRVGSPTAMSNVVELAAWAVVMHLLTFVSTAHVTVYAVGQNLFILLMFTYDGLKKGVIALASNFIGAGKKALVSKMLSSALKTHLLIALVVTVPLLIYPDFLIHRFLVEVDFVDKRHLIDAMHITCWALWVYFILDGIAWILCGLLIADKDTMFVMCVDVVNAWLFVVMPIYVVMVWWHGTPAMSWWLCCVYTAVLAVCFYFRYRAKYLVGTPA